MDNMNDQTHSFQDNICCQILVKLVARANAIITELLRLSEHIPKPFKHFSPNNDESVRQYYRDLIIDFTYFEEKRKVLFDDTLWKSAELQKKDDELRQEYSTLLVRFYEVFESIYKYYRDLTQFVEDVENGLHIQYTLESLLLDNNAKQLFIEAVAYYGIILLVCDWRIDGIVRERLIVAYFRYSSQKRNLTSNLDEVMKLLRSTGYSEMGKYVKKPHRYPEAYFQRLPIKKRLISLLVGRLQTDDLYNNLGKYPEALYRSTALASQSVLLVAILFFSSTYLHDKTQEMNQIVTRFFLGNWTISLFMGLTINLFDLWHDFRAAYSALNRNIDMNSIELKSKEQHDKLNELSVSIKQYLKEGVMNEEVALNKPSQIIRLLRDCNVTIRWIILHTNPSTCLMENNKKCRIIRESLMKIGQFSNPNKLLEFLLNTAELENRFGELFNRLLTKSSNEWEHLQKECEERLVELADVFSGKKALTRIAPNAHLEQWFRKMSERIHQLSRINRTVTGRNISALIDALDEVMSYHDLETNLQVKQFLEDTRHQLKKMSRLLNLKEDSIVHLQCVADMSYAWRLMEKYVTSLQQSIATDTTFVIKLRALFLKLSIALDQPLVRICQSNSPDLWSVSNHYTNELVKLVKEILQIIPGKIFDRLKMIINLSLKSMIELPTRLEKEHIDNYSQLIVRQKISQETNRISLLTEGILNMKSTVVGVEQLDPKKLLEDGIRKELLLRLYEILNRLIKFPKKSYQLNSMVLVELSTEINAVRQVFEYVQDYINISGLQLFNDEFSKLLSFLGEQSFRKYSSSVINNSLDISSYQKIGLPIPSTSDSDDTCLDKLLNELISCTNPKFNVYLPQQNAWYNLKLKDRSCISKHFDQLHSAISSFGIRSLDDILGRKCTFQLRHIAAILSDYLQLNDDSIQSSNPHSVQLNQQKVVDKNKMNFAKNFIEALNRCEKCVIRSKFSNTFHPILPTLKNVDMISIKFDVIDECQEKINKSLQILHINFRLILFDILQHLTHIGQVQLIRLQFAHQLRKVAVTSNPNITRTIKNFNKSMIMEMLEKSEISVNGKEKLMNKQQLFYNDNAIAVEIGDYLDNIGETNVLTTIYARLGYIPHISSIAFSIITLHLKSYIHHKNSNVFINRSNKNGDNKDLLVFTLGIGTWLSQYPNNIICQLREMINFYIIHQQFHQIQSSYIDTLHRFMDLLEEHFININLPYTLSNYERENILIH
ncbi:hypothetical protein SNEBB_011383 [Seison nebaliae]|nr:hypothetical protein SNEBB_011383 [Seison nebaliae]